MATAYVLINCELGSEESIISQLLFSSGKLNLSYTNAKNTFNDFILDGNNLNGLSLPGIPNQILDAELIFNLSKDFNNYDYTDYISFCIISFSVSSI